MTSVWLKYDKNCILCKSSQTKKSHKPKSQKAHTNPQTSKKPNGYKRAQIHKHTQNHKHAQTTQNKTKNHPQKTQKPPQIPPKSQTPYPLSQIFANPLFVAYQHLSRKIPRFPNHTPCQSSSLLAVCFDLPLCQRHT